MLPMDGFVKILADNWAVIEQVPLAFVSFSSLGALAGFWLAKLRYGGTIEAVRER